MATILLVAADPQLRAAFVQMLRPEGHRINEATCLREARDVLQARSFDIVVSDMKVESDDDGLQLLDHIKVAMPHVEVVILTGPGRTASTFRAIQHGAYDCVELPAERHRLLRIIGGALHRRTNNSSGARGPEALSLPEGIIAVDQTTRAIVTRAVRAAATDSPVLITGETGTGKEILAGIIHHFSPRRVHPLLAVNCGALPEGLIDSELFGHRKGAFTGALADRQGFAEAANRGVLFLDEIGEMPVTSQARFLRFLDKGEVLRLGETRPRHVDVRVVAATNRDLHDDVHSGRFRRDLFYRLRAVPLHMPPLRERPEDIPALAEHFLQQWTQKSGRAVRSLSEDVLVWLRAYGWPGNVRELRHVIEGSAAMSTGNAITCQDLAEAAGVARESPCRALDALPYRDGHDRVLATLQQFQGNHTLAAKALGISRTTLWRRLRHLAHPVRP